jgi:hypothetical protein
VTSERESKVPVWSIVLGGGAALAVVVLVARLLGGDSEDHGHDHRDDGVMTIGEVLELPQNAGVSGQGELEFELMMDSSALPKQVFEVNPHDPKGRTILESAHAGFALDYREGKGEVYWSLQGAGILRVDSAMTRVDLLDTDAKMVALNLHNATFFVHRDQPMIAWPANLGHRVFVTDLDGKIVHEIGRPTASPYGSNEPYKPTDTEYLDGKLWITDGYGSHWVVAYDLDAGAWTDTAFGGRDADKFRNPHGITIYDGLIYVSGRAFARIHKYREASFIDMFPLPAGSKPCDFEFFVLGDKLYGVASSLEPAKRDDHDGASIYIVDMDTLKVVSSITPKDDLGLTTFDHHHNTLPRVVDGRIYLYDQAWKNGDFAIYRQVKESLRPAP